MERGKPTPYGNVGLLLLTGPVDGFICDRCPLALKDKGSQPGKSLCLTTQRTVASSDSTASQRWIRLIKMFMRSTGSHRRVAGPNKERGKKKKDNKRKTELLRFKKKWKFSQEITKVCTVDAIACVLLLLCERWRTCKGTALVLTLTALAARRQLYACYTWSNTGSELDHHT